MPDDPPKPTLTLPPRHFERRMAELGGPRPADQREGENRFQRARQVGVRKSTQRQRSDSASHAAEARWKKERAAARSGEEPPAPGLPDLPPELALDPIAWIAAYLVDPDSDPNDPKPFILYKEEEVFLRTALTPDPVTIELPYSEVVFAAPKKSGKTALAAIAICYVMFALGGKNAEGYVASNSREQASDRVFTDVGRIIKASPKLRDAANIRTDKIEILITDSSVKTVTGEAGSAAGGRPTIVVFDELWGFTSENAQRLWDELVPTPTIPVSIRLTVTYAGFLGESNLLENLYRRIFNTEGGLEDDVRCIGTDLYDKGRFLMYWTHELRAPWQSQQWLEDMRQAYAKRPNQFERIIRNRWVSAESAFITADSWNRIIDRNLRPSPPRQRLKVWAAVDASVRRDSTAIVAVAYDATPLQQESSELQDLRDRPLIHNPLLAALLAMPWKEDHERRPEVMRESDLRCRLVRHRIFKPERGQQISFALLERYILNLKDEFDLQLVGYDPFQMVSLAQGLSAAGVPMFEIAQTAGNVLGFSQLLYDLIEQRRLRVYDDEEMKQHVLNAVAKESSAGGRAGWHIVKRTRGARIDAAVALAMAVYTCAHSCGSEGGEEDEGAESEIPDIYAV